MGAYKGGIYGFSTKVPSQEQEGEAIPKEAEDAYREAGAMIALKCSFCGSLIVSLSKKEVIHECGGLSIGNEPVRFAVTQDGFVRIKSDAAT